MGAVKTRQLLVVSYWSPSCPGVLVLIPGARDGGSDMLVREV